MPNEQLIHVLDGYKVLDFTQVPAGPTVTRLMGRGAGPPGLCCSRFVSDEGSSACFLLHGIFYPGNRAEVGVLRPQDCIVHPGGCQNNAICHWEAFLEADAGGVEGERRA